MNPCKSSGNPCQRIAVSVFAFVLTVASYGARAEIVPGEIVVRMKPAGPMAQPMAFRDSAGTAVKYEPLLQVYRVRVNPGVNPANALAKIQNRPDVLYAHPLHILHITATPNDTHFAADQYGPQKIQADKAWDLYQPKAQKIIAIVDTGVM